MKHTELKPEDQAKVDAYLNSPINQVERKPFRPWLLLFSLIGFLGLLSLISYIVGVQQGVL